MHHTRSEVIERAIREFELLNRLVESLTMDDWQRLVLRPETEDPWAVKDALAHITHHKASLIEEMAGRPNLRRSSSLGVHEYNRRVYEQWRDRPTTDVIAWHRQTHEELLAALQDAPDAIFAVERTRSWPSSIDGHSAGHRVRDIERALKLR